MVEVYMMAIHMFNYVLYIVAVIFFLGCYHLLHRFGAKCNYFSFFSFFTIHELIKIV